jgi:hypothetical protein
MALFLLIILRTGFFNRNGFERWQIAVLFLFKVAAGILYGILHGKYMQGGDTFDFFRQSEYIYRAIEVDPGLFIRLVFGVNGLNPIPPELFRYVDALSNWTDSGGYMMIRINAIFRLFSGGVDAWYNVHVIFISFMSLVGVYYLYLFFNQFIKGEKLFLNIILFAIPSIVFWYSGVHKEGVAIFAVGVIMHNSRQLYIKGFSTKYILGLGLGILFLGLVRFYLMAVILPVLVAYYMVKLLSPARPVAIYFSIFFLTFICLGVVHWLVPEFSALGEAATKQSSFIINQGETTFQIPKIGNSYWQLLFNIPYTILNPLIRPIPMDCQIILCYIASAETYLLLIGIIILLTRFRLSRLFNNNEALFCLFFGFLILVVIGLIVNNAGAIVRYRSIALPFLLIGLFLSSTFYKEKAS